MIVSVRPPRVEGRARQVEDDQREAEEGQGEAREGERRVQIVGKDTLLNFCFVSLQIIGEKFVCLEAQGKIDKMGK